MLLVELHDVTYRAWRQPSKQHTGLLVQQKPRQDKQAQVHQCLYSRHRHALLVSNRSRMPMTVHCQSVNQRAGLQPAGPSELKPTPVTRLSLGTFWWGN